MNQSEYKTTFSLASIYAFRMLGLFMILPVFSVYAAALPGSNPMLIGLALGIYGLTQACFQIPLGMLSDYIGRKTVIFFGLLIFAAGSLVAAKSHTLGGIITGRGLQGMGAVGSTLMALLADNVRENHRLKAMAVVGMTIGISFSIAMVIGPVLNGLVGIQGIFWLTAGLAIMGIFLLLFVTPTPPKQSFHNDTAVAPQQFLTILKQPELIRLNLGIFSLHATLTAMFVALPLALLHASAAAHHETWKLYLPVLIIAFIAMIPFIILAETKKQMKAVFIGSIFTLTLSFVLLIPAQRHGLAIAGVLCLFFTAFTLLEACLPSLIAKFAPPKNKGTAMGIYSTCQFLGIFIGGSAGGFLFHQWGANGLFLCCAVLSFAWGTIAIFMPNPHTASHQN